jgi:hypothetical protein
MFKFIAALLVATALVAVSTVLGQNYGSYIVWCNTATGEALWHNYFSQQNCQGNYTVATTQINQCKKELVIFSWNAGCNATNMWYNNFDNLHCSGNSVLTRWYTTGSCFNCPNPECKNP